MTWLELMKFKMAAMAWVWSAKNGVVEVGVVVENDIFRSRPLVEYKMQEVVWNSCPLYLSVLDRFGGNNSLRADVKN